MRHIHGAVKNPKRCTNTIYSPNQCTCLTLWFQMFSSMRLGGRGLARGLYLHHQAPSSRLLSSSPSLLQSELAKLRKKTGYSLSICKKVAWHSRSLGLLQELFYWPCSWVQALGENGNDGEAAEKWLAEQAQVYCVISIFTRIDNHLHSGSRFGKGFKASGSKHFTGANPHQPWQPKKSKI